MNEHIDSKLLLLYLLNELDESRYLKIQSHVKNCEICQRELHELKTWKTEISMVPKLKPGYRVLLRNRKQLMNKLEKQEKISLSIFDKIRGSLLWSPSQPKWALVAGVFVLGLILGQWNQFFSTKQSIVQNLADNSAAMTGHFKVEAIDGEMGDLQVQFSSIENHAIKGNIQDPEMQFLLSYALVHLDQDNVRLRCVNLLQQAANGEIVQDALYHAVQRDENPGVRLKAIRILKNLPLTDPLKKVLLQVFFQDKNTGIRLEAKEALKGRVAPQLLETFQVKIQNVEADPADFNQNSKMYSL